MEDLPIADPKDLTYSLGKPMTEEEFKRYRASNNVNVQNIGRLGEDGKLHVNKKCNVCSKTTVNRCSRCKKVFYCDVDCQRSDWSSHRTVCSESSRTSQ